MRLAETLVPLIHIDKARAIDLLTDEIESFETIYKDIWLTHMRAKIGLGTRENEDFKLIQGLLNAMQEGEADFTLTFRRLSDAIRGQNSRTRRLFKTPTPYNLWECKWRSRLKREPASCEERAVKMDKVNPIYIPRNHQVEEALSRAVAHSDLSEFKNLLSIVSAPFEEISGRESYAEPAPKTSVPYQTFCGT